MLAYIPYMDPMGMVTAFKYVEGGQTRKTTAPEVVLFHTSS